MRIVNMVLRDFIPFRDSAIYELQIDFNESIQFIIGSNGAGKSTYLSQLSVYPPVRSFFGKEGYKSITIENKGVYYKLDSEYDKSSSPHLFFEGESQENLNIGRTTDVQKELINNHLEITPLLDDLIMNRHNFPKWGAAKRKEFLMEVNPDKIGFVLNYAKHISSKIKACKNNLSRLNSRKILLEQDLLNEESIAILENEKIVINEVLHKLQHQLMHIEIGLKNLPSSITILNTQQISSFQNMIRNYRYKLTGLSHIERDDHLRQIIKEKTLSEIAVCEDRIKSTDDIILSLNEELINLETRYREITIDEDLSKIDETISQLENEQEKLIISKPSFELSQEELTKRYNELTNLKDRLFIFNNLSIPLWSSKKRRIRERRLNQAQTKRSSYLMRLSDLENQYQDLLKRHTHSLSDIPESPCAKNKCPLYNHFFEEYNYFEERRLKLKSLIDKGTRKVNRLNLYIDNLTRYFEDAQPYTDVLNWLIQYAQENPIFHDILRQMDVLIVLSHRPFQIVQKLETAYDHIKQWLRLKSVRSDLEAAYQLKQRQISSENYDTVKLVSSIETLKKRLYSLRNDIKRLLEDKSKLNLYLEEINHFNHVKSSILEMQKTHLSNLQNLVDYHEQEKLLYLKKQVEAIRQSHLLRLSEIESQLRSQNSLKERYQLEVLNQIGIIEKELRDQEQIEKALIQIPKENMIGFINLLFEQANRLIDTIWTLPLKLELLKEDDPLTYEFMVSGDHESLRELSKCSEGQTEIISLAFNLALRIILGYFNYPLCLDETGRTFDEEHRKRLMLLLKTLIDEKIISQLFMITHHAEIHSSFLNAETLVIRSDNIIVPEIYNEHVTFK